MSAAKNIAWLSVSRVVSLAVLFFAYTQLFRYLGVFSSGQYQFVVSYITLFGVVVDLGVSQYIVKKIAEKPEEAKRYFHNFFVAEIVLILLVYISMAGFALLRGTDQIVLQAILVSGVGVMLGGINMSFLAVLSAFQDLRRVALINLCAALINAATIAATIWLNLGIVFLSCNIVFSGLVSFILYYNFAKRHLGKPQLLLAVKDYDPALVRKLFWAAGPFALLVSFSAIYNRIDVLLITKLLGYEATGLYTAAYKFVDLANFFPAVVSHSLYPVIAALAIRPGALAELKEILFKYIRFTAFIAWPIGVAGTVLAPYLIYILAGPEFMQAAKPLAFLIWAVALLCLYIVANSYMISQLTLKAALICGFNMTVNVIGNIILLPKYGIVAAAAMTVVSETLQAALYFYFVRQKIGSLPIFRLWWKQIVSAGFMGLFLWFGYGRIFPAVSGNDMSIYAALGFLAMAVLASALVYLLGLYILRFFSSDDMVAFKKMLGFSRA